MRGEHGGRDEDKEGETMAEKIGKEMRKWRGKDALHIILLSMLTWYLF